MDLGMDMWKYYGITHTDHTVMDPLSLEKTGELVGRVLPHREFRARAFQR